MLNHHLKNPISREIWKKTELVFIIIISLITISGIGIILSKKLLHSALFLLVILLVVAGIFFQAEAEFLGVAQILVYIGGILILILFGIIVTDQKKQIDYSLVSEIPAIIIIGLFGYLLVKAVQTFDFNNNTKYEVEKTLSNSEEIGISLMSTNLFALEFVALFLLISLVGAVIIGGRKTK